MCVCSTESTCECVYCTVYTARVSTEWTNTVLFIFRNLEVWCSQTGLLYTWRPLKTGSTRTSRFTVSPKTRTHRHLVFLKEGFIRWPRELNALQLQKTHANRKSTSKSRKHLHQFDSRCSKCSQHNQINNFICSAFLCLVVLWTSAARVLSNWQSVFLICRCFFFIKIFFLLFYYKLISLTPKTPWLGLRKIILQINKYI